MLEGMPPPAFEEIAADLHSLRRQGLTRLRQAQLPALAAVLRLTRPAGSDRSPAELERLLRSAVAGLNGNLAAAAEYTFGLAPGTRDWPIGDRRRRAAQVYGVSTERFRKSHELRVVNELAERLAELCREPPSAAAPGNPYVLRLAGRLGGRPRPVTLYAMPVELVRDVDIVVSPENTYLELPQAFKTSFSASLRRAGAQVDMVGEVLDDTIQRELLEWMRKHARPGLPVAPGTVAPTSAGRLAAAGIRRIYHAAVAAHRPGTNTYEISPGAVAQAVQNVFRLAAAERRLFSPPLTSICLPLLGAGRGGLSPETSFTWTWAALDREHHRDDSWELSFAARSAPAVEAIVRGLASHP
jgi:O-acetyl-ADP-ribose deacetylase (regulator of RNase III)